MGREVKTEELLGKYLELAEVMFVAMDTDGIVTYINRNGCEVLGYCADAIVGKNWFDNFLPERQREQVKDIFKELVAGHVEPVEYYENPVLTSSGDERLIAWHNANIRDDDGGIMAVIASGEDITERRQAEQTLQLNAAMTHSLTEGLYLLGMDDMIIKWTNPAFEKMFGYGPGEIIGQQVDILNAPTELTPAETRISIVDVLRDTGEWHGEVKNIRKDGTHFWSFANASVFEHPEYGEVMVAAHTDITDRKVVERELKEKAESLKLALEKIQVLSGLLPICMHCKKVRDEEGYWSQVESYISKHSDTRFTHSICDECAKEHYPGLHGETAGGEEPIKDRE